MERFYGDSEFNAWDGTKGDFLGLYTLGLGLTSLAACGWLLFRDRRTVTARDRLLSIAPFACLASALLLTAFDLGLHGGAPPADASREGFDRASGISFTALWALAGAWCAWLLLRRTRAAAAEHRAIRSQAPPDAPRGDGVEVAAWRTRRFAWLSAVCAIATFMGVLLPWYAMTGDDPAFVPEDRWRPFDEFPAFGWNGILPLGLGLVAMAMGLVACIAATRLFVNVDESTPMCPPGRRGWSLGRPRVRAGGGAKVCLLALGLAALITLVDEAWFYRTREFSFLAGAYKGEPAHTVFIHHVRQWGIHFTCGAAILGTGLAFLLFRRTRALSEVLIANPTVGGRDLRSGGAARLRAPVRGAIPLAFILLGAVALALSAVRRHDGTPVNGFRDALPGVRISYPDLRVALGEVRAAFTDTMGPGPPTPKWPGLYPVESLWLNGDDERRGDFVRKDQLPLLGGPDGAKLPDVSHDAAYRIFDNGGDHGWMGHVDFPPDLAPQVRAYGVNSAQWAAIAAGVHAAFSPYAPPVLSHPEAVRYGLALFWIAIQTIYYFRTRARHFGVWSASTVWVGLTPMAGIALLIWAWGGHSIPRIVAYAADASWWERNSSDLLLGLIAAGVTTALILGIRFDIRARARRAALEAAGVNAQKSAIT